jgi:hypothetical protein
MNFYSMLNFFPILLERVYTPTPRSIGLKRLGIGFATPIGATVINWLLSVFKEHNRELLLLSCVLMNKCGPFGHCLSGKVFTDRSIAAFGGGLASINPNNPELAIVFGAIAGFGIGGVIVPASTIAITICADSVIATTVALSLSIRVIGGSIGYSI